MKNSNNLITNVLRRPSSSYWFPIHDCALPITMLGIFQSHIHCVCNMLNHWSQCVAPTCQYHNLVSGLMDSKALKSHYCISSFPIDQRARKGPHIHALMCTPCFCVCVCLYLSRTDVNLSSMASHDSICLMLPVAKQPIRQHWCQDACGNAGVGPKKTCYRACGSFVRRKKKPRLYTRRGIR